MKTLLVYFSAEPGLSKLCLDSAREGAVDVLALEPRYEKSALWQMTAGAYKAACGDGVRLEPFCVEPADYDIVIIATDVVLGFPCCAVNEFLQRCNLSARETIGIIVHPGKGTGRPGDILRRRIALAGGDCKAVFNIPRKELQTAGCGLITLLRKKAAQAA